jgi:predicted CXXCH cytochrome family protein
LEGFLIEISKKRSSIKALIVLLLSILPLSTSIDSLINNVHAAEKKRRTKEELIAEAEWRRDKQNKHSNVIVVYPKNNMILFEKRDWIAGITHDKKLETVSIQVKSRETGEVIDSKQIDVEYNGFFIYTAEFAPGENRITVDTFTLDIFYKEDDKTTPPIKFKEMLVHRSVPELCEECHDIFDEWRRFPLNSESTVGVCDNCHKSSLYNRLRHEYKYVHMPIEKGKCETCHDVHVSKIEGMLARPQIELCYGCHALFIDKIKKNEFNHIGDQFDLFSKTCTKCHNPHSSNIKNLLRDVRKGVCKKCHKVFSGEKEGVEHKSIHKLVLQGKCYLCHNIHSGKNKMYLIKEDAKATCLVCHGKKVTTGHGERSADLRRKKMLAATEEGKKLAATEDGEKLAECIECHNPHISYKEGLFTDKGIDKCLSCHKGLNYRKDIPQKSQCQLCHSPHSNVNFKLTKVPCKNCHEAEKLKEKHLGITPGYEKCSKCHQLHGSGEKGLLSRNTHPLIKKRCEACHKDNDINTAGNTCYECHKENYNEAHPQAVRTEGKCIECHNVHGGGVQEMLSEDQHRPFAERKCFECHKSVEVSAELSAKAKSAELCLGCHKTIDQDIEGAPYAVTHKPFENRECIKCHEIHASPYPKLSRDYKHLLCYKCHKDKEKDAVGEPYYMVHQPVSAGNCVTCHSPHGSKYKSILNQKGNDLCFTCHDNFLENISGFKVSVMDKNKKVPLFKTIHKPITEEGCTPCHDPHASDEDKLLKANIGEFFCFKCHEDFTIDEEGFNRMSVHEPVLKGECGKCHETHATDNPKLLKVLPNDLCFNCHNSKKKHHEVVAEIIRKKTGIPESFELYKKSTLMCTSCHDPHSSDDYSLIRGTKKTLCTKCHPSVPQ